VRCCGDGRVRGRRRLSHLPVVALLALATISCQPSTDTPIGMTVHVRDAEVLAEKFDLMAEMGVTWVRMDIDWSVVERTQGSPDWSYPDMVVDEADARGMQVLFVLAFTPPWARTAAVDDATIAHHQRPQQLSQWADFARAAATRYAPRGVHSWEIWNEPNTAKFWPPQPDANEYGTLFWVAADAIRDVDPQATLLIGGLGPQFETPGREIEPGEYLEQLYANGAAYRADAVAAHPYSFPALPMQTPQRMTGGFADLPALRSVMEHHGEGDKSIWITEYGAPTGTGPNAVSDDTQTQMLLQARRQVADWSWAGPLIYYELADGGTDPADPEQNFGVVRRDLTPKPAAVALMDGAT